MNARTKEFDNLTVLSSSMKSMVEASRLMNRLAYLPKLEVMFEDRHGTDRRVYVRDFEDGETYYVASVRRPREKATETRHDSFEKAFTRALEGM